MTLIHGLQTIGIGFLRAAAFLFFAVLVAGLTVGGVFVLVYIAGWLPTVGAVGAAGVGVVIAGGVLLVTCRENIDEYFLLFCGGWCLVFSAYLILIPVEPHQTYWFQLGWWALGDGLLMVCAGVGLKYREREEEKPAPTPTWKLPPNPSQAKETV